jgi:hypothetical protein
MGCSSSKNIVEPEKHKPEEKPKTKNEDKREKNTKIG